MRNTEIICDRCGKDAFYFIPKPLEAFSIEIKYRGIRPNRSLDLCRSCVKDFEKFMQSAPNINQHKHIPKKEEVEE